MASQDQSAFEAVVSNEMESSPSKKELIADVTCLSPVNFSSSETTNAVNNCLWNTPESGTFKNSNFIRPVEVKSKPSSDSVLSNGNNLNKHFDGITDPSNVIEKTEEECHLITKDTNKLELKDTDLRRNCSSIDTKSNLASQKTTPEVIELDDENEMEQNKQTKHNNKDVKNIKDKTDIEKGDDNKEVNGSQEDVENFEDDIADYLDDMEDDDEELLREIEELSKSNKALAEKRKKKQCIRNECTNPAVDNPYWDKEFCSNDCVVGYCKTTFLKWVESAQKQSS